MTLVLCKTQYSAYLLWCTLAQLTLGELAATITQRPLYPREIVKRDFDGPNTFGYIDGDIGKNLIEAPSVQANIYV